VVPQLPLFPRSPDYESTIAAARFLKGRRQLLFGPGVESPLRTNTYSPGFTIHLIVTQIHSGANTDYSI